MPNASAADTVAAGDLSSHASTLPVAATKRTRRTRVVVMLRWLATLSSSMALHLVCVRVDGAYRKWLPKSSRLAVDVTLIETGPCWSQIGVASLGRRRTRNCLNFWRATFSKQRCTAADTARDQRRCLAYSMPVLLLFSSSPNCLWASGEEGPRSLSRPSAAETTGLGVRLGFGRPLTDSAGCGFAALLCLHPGIQVPSRLGGTHS